MRRASLLFVLGLVLLVGGTLGATQWHARQQYLWRGRPLGFPTPLPDTGLDRACVNASLEQYDSSQLTWALDTISEGGFVWMRQHFPWDEIEPRPGEFNWTTWDTLVSAAKAHHLHLIAVLDRAPQWAGMPPDPQAFAAFASTLAARYGESLTYYEIWHNPNLGESWGGAADAFGYAELLSNAAQAIRAADPDARIILGSLAPNEESGPQNYAEDLFLKMLQVAGAQSSFDVVAVQPYGFNTGPEDRRVSRQVLNFSRAILTRETLVSLGMGDKAVWASDFGWNTSPPAIWGLVDESQQVQNTLGALERAEREWPWMGVMCLNTFQPRPMADHLVPDAEEHWGFALVGPDGHPKPLYAALQAHNDQPRVAVPGVYNANTSLAEFSGAWTLGPQGADIGQSGDQVTLRFKGTGVALTVRRGPYRAFLFVTVDGQPAPALPRDRQGRAYVVLYDPLAAVATVPLAEHLPYGEHTVTVIAERGWNQWALADWRIADRPDTTPYTKGLLLFASLSLVGLGLAVWYGRQIHWGRVGRHLHQLWFRLHESVRQGAALLLAALYLLASWQLMMSESVWRHLGTGRGWTAVLLALALAYFSPWLPVALLSGGLVTLLVCLDPAIGLALTLFTAPLYLHPLSLLGKSFALAELILLPTLLGGLLQLIGRKQFSPRKLWAQLPKSTVAFIGVAILSTAFATQRHEAIRELRLVILEPLLCYWMLITYPLSRNEKLRLVDAFIAGGVLVAVVGLVQYFILGDVITAEGGMWRLHSVYGSPNNVGLYLGRVIPLALAVTLWGGKDTGIRRWVYGGSLGLLGAALLLSLSKGALVLGVPAALLSMGFLAGKRWRRATWGVLGAGLLALIPLLHTPRFAGLFNVTGGTSGFRLALWHSAWQMIRDHPLLGVGPDNFLYAYRTRYVLPTAWEEFNLSHPHNLVMDYAARLGLLGLLSGLWLQVTFWKRAWPLRRHPAPLIRALALGAMGAMADFLAHGMVDASYFVVDLAYAFFFLFAIVSRESR